MTVRGWLSTKFGLTMSDNWILEETDSVDSFTVPLLSVLSCSFNYWKLDSRVFVFVFVFLHQASDNYFLQHNLEDILCDDGKLLLHLVLTSNCLARLSFFESPCLLSPGLWSTAFSKLCWRRWKRTQTYALKYGNL